MFLVNDRLVWIDKTVPRALELWTSAPKLCIFLYNAMETTGVRQGMGIMHSDVMDTVFHSGNAWDSMP